MTSVPDTIVVKRDLELAGRRREVAIRRGLFALLPVVTVLALLNLFGQRPSTSTATVSKAALDVWAPARVRGGLLYEARFDLRARTGLDKAILVLDRGWLENITVNSIEPQPVGEGSADGKLTLELGHVAAGKSYALYLYFQVNPTSIGRRTTNVSLYDGPQKLLQIDRTLTVLP